MPNSRPYVVILTRRWPTMNRQVLFCFNEFIHNLASFQRFRAEVWLPLLKFDDQYGLSPSKSGFIIPGRFYPYLEDPEIPGAFAQVLFAQFRYCARMWTRTFIWLNILFLLFYKTARTPQSDNGNHPLKTQFVFFWVTLAIVFRHGCSINWYKLCLEL